MTNDAKQHDSLLSMKQVMERLCLKRTAITERIRDGRLVAYKEGNQYRFKPADVQEYIDNLETA